MATHARQQYFADESSLSKEKREFSIAEEVQQKIDSIEEGAQVNTIETIKVNGSEVQPDENKAVDLTIPGVVDSLDSTSSTDALSAKQGKVLYDYIQDVSHIGHFLALWDASTGLPVTDPETSPYIYNTGDFYTVSVVASGGGTNYKPDGTQYVIGQASTAVDTDDVEVNDFYFYDGQVWRHMKNSGAGSIAVDGSLSTTSTNPVENRVITNALNGKADATDINTKTFFLADRSDLTTAQAAIDWYRAGNNPIIILGNSAFSLHNINSGAAKFVESTYFESNSSGVSQYLEYVVDFNMSNRTVTSISPHGQNMVSYLDTMRTPTGTFTPTLDWQPATKKYVDDHAGTTYTAGANIQISNENVISATDTKYTAGTGISIDANNVISNTQTSAEWGNITGTLSDQTDLQNALDAKADDEDVNVKVFHIATTNDLINAQEAIDWWEQGRLTGAYTPLIEFGGGKELYGLLSVYDNFQAIFTALTPEKTQSRTNTTVSIKQIVFSLTGTPGQPQTVTAISTSNYLDINYLDTDTSYSSSYTPQYDGSPATKKYVDDSVNLKSFGAFPGSGLSDLQDLYDWLTAGNYGEVTYGNQVYIFGPTNITTGNVESYVMRETDISSNESGVLDMKDTVLTFAVSNGTVTGNYGADSTTTGQGRIIYVNSAAGQPSNPQASSFWYDTTNNKLKVYDGSNWNVVGDDAADINTKTFHLATNDLTTGQAIYDWISQGKYAIVYLYSTFNGYGGPAFFDPTTTTTGEIVSSELMTPYIFPNGDLTLGYGYIKLVVSAGTVTAVQRNVRDESVGYVVIASNTAPSNPVDGSLWFDTTTNTLKVFRNFQPLGQGWWQDLGGVTSSATTPTNSYEGMVWYDTTNDKLKVYDGSNWNEVGKEYNAGEGIVIGTIHSDMQGPAPDGFHVPLDAEWIALCGVLTTTFSMASNATTMGTYLKIPMAGRRRYNTSSVSDAGSYGFYWSSTPEGDYAAYSLYFGSSILRPQLNYSRAQGFSVRCFKNYPVVPTSSWTTLYQGTGSAGIFWDSTDGLISVSGDGTTWYTIQDKNLGATTVFNQGDTLTDANCGYFYQRGNNYGFAHSGTVTISNTQVDTSTYGPGNYYSSSTFIRGSDDRSSVRNDNIWGGISQGIWVTDGNTITNTGVLSVNGQTGNVTVSGLQKASDSPLDIQYFWAGTQAQYDALSSYSDDTVYLTI